MIEPKSTRDSFGFGDRDPPRLNKLFLYDGMKLRRTSVSPRASRGIPRRSASARSSSSGATRGGIRRIRLGEGRGADSTRPGNPLGTRWMGLSAPAVGIHGTPDPASIGYSVSHGCIRMRIPEVEWLFTQVDIGTPVYILQ